MKLIVWVLPTGIAATPRTPNPGTFTLTLPNHRRRLKWSAPSFAVVQKSAKPNSREIGLRA